MQRKHSIVALVAAGLISVQAHAQEALPASPAVFGEAELTALFDSADKPLQLSALSEQEMRETEGAWWPVVYRVGGGLAGMYGAGYGYLAAGGRDPYTFIGTALGGFAGGLWSPVKGYRSAIGTFGGAFSSTALPTFGSNRGWW
ncbi:MAG: hypothetical protein N2512_10745 [Armatimonadetes bacterium]|nr:hypothetical protein [Armatimonadota bacterium]